MKLFLIIFPRISLHCMLVPVQNREYETDLFHVKFHAKNRDRTNREAMSAISVFQVKFNVEFMSQVMDFP